MKTLLITTISIILISCYAALSNDTPNLSRSESEKFNLVESEMPYKIVQ
jgi:hypothetical protein